MVKWKSVCGMAVLRASVAGIWAQRTAESNAPARTIFEAKRIFMTWADSPWIISLPRLPALRAAPVPPRLPTGRAAGRQTPRKLPSLQSSAFSFQPHSLGQRARAQREKGDGHAHEHGTGLSAQSAARETARHGPGRGP